MVIKKKFSVEMGMEKGNNKSKRMSWLGDNGGYRERYLAGLRCFRIDKPEHPRRYNRRCLKTARE